MLNIRKVFEVETQIFDVNENDSEGETLEYIHKVYKTHAYTQVEASRNITSALMRDYPLAREATIIEVRLSQ